MTGLGQIPKHVRCPRYGNFGDLVINAFLHYHSTPVAWLYLVAESISSKLDAEMLLRVLPADQDTFMLGWNGGDRPQEGAYGHAVCVSRHPVSNE